MRFILEILIPYGGIHEDIRSHDLLIGIICMQPRGRGLNVSRFLVVFGPRPWRTTDDMEMVTLFGKAKGLHLLLATDLVLSVPTMK